MTAEPLLQARRVHRTYGAGATEVRACQDVSFDIMAGELVAVKGPSGSGKTTLLNVLGGLDKPTSGAVFLGGNELSAMSESQLVSIRRRQIGYIFQSFGLVSILSAAENIEVPLRLLGYAAKRRRERVSDLLDRVGLAEHANQRPHELSGGQQQRVAIARALAGQPELLIADEPTGQLDSNTARSIMELIRGLVNRQGLTVIVATHDPALVDLADRVLELHDGRLVVAESAEADSAPA
ncbi:ABC transporter ATP-binding protein [Phytoactinopolyspora alkaliphila]|uniref:ABC transporter ATP-binding protein n=1 Tax=Phytoactinopolyspora alkaliphila TaxID=1783498 RepID=A0A6N9YG59_9ACTN|nr:ABC transporter ATP-binding protein [Phytoactinopolyspora alkaliphila]NED93996.1 ABC transporter ATP-binding protein [Phytoactinopolyspora alkaliphila]